MEVIIGIVIGIIALVVGGALGFIVAKFMGANSIKQAESKAKITVEEAKSQAKSLRKEAIVEAKDEALQIKQEAEKEKNQILRDVRGAENRLNQKEESLDRRESKISEIEEQLDEQVKDYEIAKQEVEDKLVNIAQMSAEEAKEELLKTLSDDVAKESAQIIKNAEEQAKAEADKQSRRILSLAIQRIAADHSSEATVNSVSIPSDDIKGRIIGREGRNIRSFEQVTGTQLIIDDSPETITISCFDPVRREIARVTMESLIADGRIHPGKIEEMFNKAQRNINQRVREAGEQAVYDIGCMNVDKELVNMLGRLLYRTSYGQNVLNHSIEVSHLAGVMASELGLDPTNAKRAGLLHDIGKAVSQEVEGSHAIIGADFAKKFGEREDIVHAIASHHGEVEANSVLDVLVQAADAISAARPGARKESMDAYIKRLQQLEEIANKQHGVQNTYAIQAGREIRIMVNPKEVDEDKMVVMARDIAKEIEDNMNYPGQIKVNIIRESRVEDFAK